MSQETRVLRKCKYSPSLAWNINFSHIASVTRKAKHAYTSNASLIVLILTTDPWSVIVSYHDAMQRITQHACHSHSSAKLHGGSVTVTHILMCIGL